MLAIKMAHVVDVSITDFQKLYPEYQQMINQGQPIKLNQENFVKESGDLVIFQIGPDYYVAVGFTQAPA
jgi:hypothetical protein